MPQGLLFECDILWLVIAACLRSCCDTSLLAPGCAAPNIGFRQYQYRRWSMKYRHAPISPPSPDPFSRFKVTNRVRNQAVEPAPAVTVQLRHASVFAISKAHAFAIQQVVQGPRSPLPWQPRWCCSPGRQWAPGRVQPPSTYLLNSLRIWKLWQHVAAISAHTSSIMLHVRPCFRMVDSRIQLRSPQGSLHRVSQTLFGQVFLLDAHVLPPGSAGHAS